MATDRTSLSRRHLLQAMQVKSGMEIWTCLWNQSEVQGRQVHNWTGTPCEGEWLGMKGGAVSVCECVLNGLSVSPDWLSCHQLLNSQMTNAAVVCCHVPLCALLNTVCKSPWAAIYSSMHHFIMLYIRSGFNTCRVNLLSSYWTLCEVCIWFQHVWTVHRLVCTRMSTLLADWQCPQQCWAALIQYPS